MIEKLSASERHPFQGLVLAPLPSGPLWAEVGCGATVMASHGFTASALTRAPLPEGVRGRADKDLERRTRRATSKASFSGRHCSLSLWERVGVRAAAVDIQGLGFSTAVALAPTHKGRGGHVAAVRTRPNLPRTGCPRRTFPASSCAAALCRRQAWV